MRKNAQVVLEIDLTHDQAERFFSKKSKNIFDAFQFLAEILSNKKNIPDARNVPKKRVNLA